MARVVDFLVEEDLTGLAADFAADFRAGFRAGFREDLVFEGMDVGNLPFPIQLNHLNVCRPGACFKPGELSGSEVRERDVGRAEA